MTADLDGEHSFTADPVGPDPLIGTVLEGKYALKRALGAGGMGAVYEAEHLVIGKRVAVKVLHKEFCSNPEIVKRFVREARSATAIGHPNIVDVFDMGTMEGGGFFQVIELLEGSSLQDALATSGPMSYARTVTILSQVADALAAVHDKGIVHRDLKPDNVFLVDRPGQPDFVKLLDFGVAKVIDANSGVRTRTGMIIGTPSYMSPEQAQGTSDVDQRTDVFALGVMAFELLTGVRAFEAESFPQTLFQICIAETPALSTYRADAPDGLQAVLERMLVKNKADRFPDCREVKAALAPYASLDAQPLLSEGQPVRQPLSVSAIRKSGQPTDPFAATGVLDTNASGALGDPPHAVQALSTGPGRGDLEAANATPARSSRVVVAAVAAALVLAALGAFAYGSGDSTSEVAAPSIASSAAATVRVQLQAEPPDAELFLDDAPVGNPYVAELPASTSPHIVEARLQGHRSARRPIAFETPVNLTLTLVPDPAWVAPQALEPTVGAAEPVVGEVDDEDTRRAGRSRRPRLAGAVPSVMAAAPAASPMVVSVPPAPTTTAAPAPGEPAASPMAAAPSDPEPSEPPPQALKRVRW